MKKSVFSLFTDLSRNCPSENLTKNPMGSKENFPAKGLFHPVSWSGARLSFSSFNLLSPSHKIVVLLINGLVKSPSAVRFTPQFLGA
jgi:hypothetical protein